MVTVETARFAAGRGGSESELLGRDEGGLTGAHRKPAGASKLAARQQIFLERDRRLGRDGCTPSLLRVLQTGVRGGGGHRARFRVDARGGARMNLASTGRGLFREDL